MATYQKISADTFQKLQRGAGIVCKTFDPAKPAAVKDTDILFATSGGVNFTATPSYTDDGEDIDNCPVNMMEFKQIESWEATLSGTALTIDSEVAALMVGAADAAGNKITPRNKLNADDFKDVWWVGDYGDEGGCVAIHLMKTLSTDGFNLQTGKGEKGQFSFTLTAHYSLSAQDEPPFEIYVIKAATAAGAGA